MKNSIRFLLVLLIAVMLLALPLLIPTGSMLSDYQDQWMEWSYSILRVANAEEPVTLPIDLTPGMQPDPSAYTEDGYEDASISVKIEHYVDEEKNLSFRKRVKEASLSAKQNRNRLMVKRLRFVLWSYTHFYTHFW